MTDTRTNFIRAYWIVTVLGFVAATSMVVWYTPTEATMGPVQKIFYLHLPVAISTFLACMINFIASIGYLSQRRSGWDDLAAASARISVQLCIVVLITGMIWARSAWGLWWTWSPRLTFSLVLWLLYIVYLMIRMSIESSQRRAIVCAVYGIIAFLDVPLVYLSVKLMPDVHPESITLAWPMKLTLVVWFVPVILLTAGLIVAKTWLNARERESATRRFDATDESSPAPARRAQPRVVGGLP